MAQMNEKTARIMLSDDASAASHSIAADSAADGNRGDMQMVSFLKLKLPKIKVG